MVKLKIYTVNSVHNIGFGLRISIRLIQEMAMNRKALKHVGAALVLVTLFSILFVFLPTQKVMATTTISISPSSGIVGDRITVNGTIDTTNGTFSVRWNQAFNITTGRAVGFDVTASFVVPQTVGAPSGRNVTVELIDDLTGAKDSADFTLFTKFYMSVVDAPVLPRQLQEGSTTRIAVNVTGGAAYTVYTANVTVKNPANQTRFILASMSNTTTSGYGESVKTYPTDFVGANTNYTGKYIAAFNDTITKEFLVGLTDKIEYRRNETASVQAVGYRPSELVRGNITIGASAVSGFPKVFIADNTGKVTFTWQIPLNATPGTYNLTLTTAQGGGTVKTPLDTQTFQVLGVVSRIQTKNLTNEGIGAVPVEVYKAASAGSPLMSGTSNATGWIIFNLDGGNYTFKAFWKNTLVGSLNKSITEDTFPLDFVLQLNLTDMRIIVEDADGGLPLIDLRFGYNYTTRFNENKSETVSLQTNILGIAEMQNVFANLSYVLEARRYGFLLPGSPLRNETLPEPLNTIVIFVPKYTAVVNVFDSKAAGVSGLRISAYEWSSGITLPVQTQTSNDGKATLFLTFGKYRLIAYDDSLVLNQTTLDLIQNNLNFTFQLAILNLDANVWVGDYFGQPIANANVTIERKIGNEFVFAYSQLTGPDGTAKFVSKVGGDSRISIYVGGKLVAATTQFLGAGSQQVSFRIGEYVAIAGYPVETGLFVLFSFLIVLAVVSMLILARGRLMRVFRIRLKR